MRKIIRVIDYSEYSDKVVEAASLSTEIVCPNCYNGGGMVFGGEFTYEGSRSVGYKFECNLCGAKGIEWSVLEESSIEFVEPDTMDVMGDELNQPIDKNY